MTSDASAKQPGSLKYEFLVRDWKEQVNIPDLNAAMRRVSPDSAAYLTDVDDTGGDCFALVVSSSPLTSWEAQILFEEESHE